MRKQNILIFLNQNLATLKIIAVGDTHGRDNWKDITASTRFDKIIFMGDYFDTHKNVTAEVQIKNFNEIIAYKNKLKDKAILLLGNHDYHYLDPTYEKYSGFQPQHEQEISDLLNNALEANLIQISYVWHRFIFTHAGVTKTWCRENLIDIKDIENSLNNLFVRDPEAYMFTCGVFGDPSGNDVTQSPIWVRPNSLLQDKLDKYIQIVGHTQQDKLTLINNVAFIDTLGTSGEFLILEKDKISSSTDEIS